MTDGLHRALDFWFRIDGDDPGREFARRVMAPLRATGTTVEPVTAIALRSGPAGWSAHRGELTVYEGALQPAMSRLVTAVNVAAIDSVGGGLVAHGGAVVAPTGAVLVPGAPGAGKSTLTAALVAAGCGYLTDEAAPIGVDGLIRPYPKPIVVSAGSFEVLADLVVVELGAGQPLGERSSWFLDPGRLAGGIATDDAPWRWVVVPERRTGAAVAIEPISRAEAVAAVAANLFTLGSLDQPTLDRLEQLSRAVTGVRVVHDDARAAAAALVELVA